MMKVKQVTIAEKDLDALCQKAGITRKRLSQEAGVNYIFLSKAARGHVMVSGDTWNKLKEILDKYV